MARHYTEAEKEQAKILWGGGLSLSSVATEVGCSVETIKAWRKANVAAWNACRAAESNSIKESLQEAAAQLIPTLIEHRINASEKKLGLMKKCLENAALSDDDPDEMRKWIANLDLLDRIMDRHSMLPTIQAIMSRESAGTQQLSGPKPGDPRPEEEPIQLID